MLQIIQQKMLWNIFQHSPNVEMLLWNLGIVSNIERNVSRLEYSLLAVWISMNIPCIVTYLYNNKYYIADIRHRT